jgi:hypothetical protein
MNIKRDFRATGLIRSKSHWNCGGCFSNLSLVPVAVGSDKRSEAISGKAESVDPAFLEVMDSIPSPASHLLLPWENTSRNSIKALPDCRVVGELEQ